MIIKSVMLCLGTEKGEAVLQSIVKKLDRFNLHLIIRNEVGVSTSYRHKIEDIAIKNNIPIYQWESFKSNAEQIIKSTKIETIICVGWSHLISEDIVSAVHGEVIVAHDSILPKYRGFAPLASALINGEKEVGVTVLYAEKEVDAGDIIFQKTINVTSDDTIKTLQARLCPLYVEGIVEYLRCWTSGQIKRVPQDHTAATYSIWRNREDYFIDWNKSAKYINRYIRALGPPYLGARTNFKNEIIIIYETKELNDVNFEIRQPGKVWRLEDGKPVVVCGQGMLMIQSAKTKGGGSIIPLKKLKVWFK